MVTGKILVTGHAQVGKTSIVKKYIYGKFDDEYFHSLGERIDSKQLNVHNTKVELSILDSGKGNRDLNLLDPDYLHVSGIIHVVDAGNTASYADIHEQLKIFRHRMPYVPLFIAINKSDKASISPVYFFSKYISEDSIFFTSAKNGKHLDVLFNRMGEELLKRYKRNVSFLNFF